MSEDSSQPRKPAKRQARPWLRVLVYLAIWIAILTALVIQLSWGQEVSTEQAFVRIIRDWGPWILLGPLLWWLVKRFPLFGERKFYHIGVHLITCLLMVALAETLVAFVFHPATNPMLERSQDSDRDFIRELRGNRPRPISRAQEYRVRPRTIARKLPIWLLIYWVFALIATAVLQRRAAEERARRALALQNDLTQARFRELQSRLNPHFLFNALNSIAALIQIDPDKAEEMVTRLSSLLRRVLSSGEQSLIPLRDELDLLRDYLAIEQVRFSDRLSVEESIDDTLLSVSIPPLTLQPLAENAIKHGIEPKSEPSTLQVKVSANERKQVELQIIDDGIGFDSSSTPSGLGIGLDNVRDRLINVFQDEASLSVTPSSGGGTTVTVAIPTQAPSESRDAG